jgi:hypothetical protein
LPECAQFKLYIQNELESRMTNEVSNLGFDGLKPRYIHVAQITFAYDNAQIINWLLERGRLISDEQWTKLQYLNDKVLEELKEKQTDSYKRRAERAINNYEVGHELEALDEGTQALKNRTISYYQKGRDYVSL